MKSPASRAVGFAHQGSQWSHISRYDLIISTIKEACLRAYRSGLEGVSIHGEVTSRHIPSALNYLAFSHFIPWPEDTLRDFGRKTLGQVLGDEKEGEDFIEVLANWDSGSITDAQENDTRSKAADLERRISMGDGLEHRRYWHWLYQRLQGNVEKYTSSFF